MRSGRRADARELIGRIQPLLALPSPDIEIANAPGRRVSRRGGDANLGYAGDDRRDTAVDADFQ